MCIGRVFLILKIIVGCLVLKSCNFHMIESFEQRQLAILGENGIWRQWNKFMSRKWVYCLTGWRHNPSKLHFNKTNKVFTNERIILCGVERLQHLSPYQLQKFFGFLVFLCFLGFFPSASVKIGGIIGETIG